MDLLYLRLATELFVLKFLSISCILHDLSVDFSNIAELARQQRQRRKIRRRWFWSCIGVSIAIGISAVAYSYLPQASKHQEGSVVVTPPLVLASTALILLRHGFG